MESPGIRKSYSCAQHRGEVRRASAPGSRRIPQPREAADRYRWGRPLALPLVTESFDDGLARALPRLRGILARRGRVAGLEAEDVAQEVAVRALRYRARFDERRGLWPWLRRLAERVLLDQRAALARRVGAGTALDPDASPARAGEAELDADEELAHLLAPLARVEREVLLRFHRDGQAVRAIAAALGLPEGTVKSHLSRARRRLAGLGDKGAGA